MMNRNFSLTFNRFQIMLKSRFLIDCFGQIDYINGVIYV